MRLAAFTMAAGLTALTALVPLQPARGAASWAPAASCSSGLGRLDPASDEFDGPLGGRWRVYDVADGDRSAELAYVPEAVRVENGVLRLYIRKEQPDDGINGYPAGAVESEFHVPGATAQRASCVRVRTRGFAANVAAPDAWDQNVFSAVWLHDRPATYDKNPNPEIDVQEFLRSWHIDSPDDETPTGRHPDHCYTGVPDDSPEGPGIDDCRTEPLGLGDLTASQHTYGLRREIATVDGKQVGLLTFYVDGTATWTRQFAAGSAFVTDDRHVILSTQGNPPGDPGPPFPKVALHAWVRTYN